MSKRSGSASSGMRSPGLTLPLILDALEGCRVLHMPTEASRHISWCQAYFRNDNRYSHPDADEENVLYFAEAAEVKDALAAHPQALVATLAVQAEGEMGELAPLSAADSKRTLVLAPPSEGLSLACALSLAQMRVQRIHSWNLALKTAAGKEGSIQRLLDLAEDMFGNFVHVSDGSYALIGYTKGIEPVGSLNTALVCRGYHDAEAVGRARREGVFGQWKKQHGVCVFEPNNEIPCPFMSYVMRHRGQYCGHVVMVCNHVEVSTLQVALFEAFAITCNEVVERELSEASLIRPQFFSYVTRLIEDSRCSQEFVNSQSATTGIPAEGLFQLVAIDVETGDLGIQGSFLASSLARELPSSFIFQYGGFILALIYQEAFSVKHARLVAEALRRFCAQSDSLAYLSDDFNRIRDIRLAYQQICELRKHRRPIDVWNRPDDDIAVRRVFTFDDAFTFSFFSTSCPPELRDFSASHSALMRIASTQPEGDMGDLRFLHCYLRNERRTSPTAAQLGIHRNSVIYRAHMFRERYDIDLDQPSVRERLALCLKMRIATDPAFASQLAGV